MARSSIKVCILIAISLLYSMDCKLGVDVSQLYAQTVFQCLKKDGFTFAIIRGYCSFGGLDHNAVQSLTHAKGAGLQTDIYMFPCRGKSATAQVDQMLKGIAGHLYGKVWIDVETNPSSGCSWNGHDHASNCQFLTQVVDKIKAGNKQVGIYASTVMWESIMGSKTACKGLGSHQLWYAHYDGKQSFTDYQEFGGWPKPSMKQFQGDVTVCGAGIDKNYRP